MYHPEDSFAGRYTLKRSIGRGGFGEVWQALDRTTGHDVAIKIINSEGPLDRALIEDCSKEYSTTLELRHTHLLTPSYFSIDHGVMYLVMPLAASGSLARVIRRGVLSEDAIANVLHQLGSGLSYLHEMGVLHNDIKPDNVLIDGRGNYLLTDFGISTKTRLSVSRSTRGSSAEQVRGITIQYSAPELFGSRPTQSKATDVFAFGVMLYELCTGEVPWMGQGGLLLNSGAMVPDLPDHYAGNLNALVKRCMSVDWSQRPTAAALAEIGRSYKQSGKWPLETAQEATQNGTFPEGKTQTPPAPPVRKTSNTRFLISIAIIVLIVGLIYYDSQKKTAQPHPPEPVVQQPQVIEVPDEKEIEEDLDLDTEVTEETVFEPVQVEEAPEEEVDEIFVIVENTAEYPGGLKAFYEYCGKNIKYPAQARRMGVEGRVFVEFVVGKDGTLTDFKVQRGLGAGLDEEALRVLKACPKWKPARQGAKIVRQRMLIPITFRLD